MCHFGAPVFGRNIEEIETLLEPFGEYSDAGSPYTEFVEDKECEYDETAKARGYWYNPNAKWDYWEIGGDFCGMLKLLPGKTGYNISNGRCDAALVADCDFSPSEGEIHRATRTWEIFMQGDRPRDGELFYAIWKPSYYLKRDRSKKTFVRRRTSFNCRIYAFVTADGKWFEQDWDAWIYRDNNVKGTVSPFEKEFDAYLEKAREQGLMIAIVDCHI